MARTRPRRRDLWAGWRPNGIGETKPHHYGEIVRALWANRRRLPYAARIVRHGVCDGCALGVAGLHDWTIDGVHLCTTRLSLLSTNTMDAADPSLLADVAALRARSGRELRSLGRLGHPMIRRSGEPGFSRVSWDAALDAVAGAVRPADPARCAFYLTARGITNEVYYVAQKVARFLGTNNIDNAARVCHAPSTAALKQAVGAIATTISYRDLMATDLVVLWGANVANAQPVMMKYLYLARKEGTRVAVVNPHREPGLERYWVPSSPESALLGTRMSDAFLQVNVGGDEAFATGVLKLLIEEGGVDERFVRDHAVGFEAVRDECARHTLAELGAMSGVGEEGLRRFAEMYRASESAVFVWSMGITQHAFGSDNVRALLNLALARGNVGRPGAGLMPIRGHSGVQGGAEMGAYATAFPGSVPIAPESARALSDQYGFPVPGARGLTAEEMIEAAGRGELDVLYLSGGNFLDVLPDPALVAERLARVPMRVHQDIVVSSQMLVDPPPAARWCCSPRPPGTSRPAGGPRRPPSGASPSARRSPARGRARRGPSGRSSSTSPAGSTRSARSSWTSPMPRPSARRSRASCPSTTASSTSGRPATRCSGEGRASATAGSSPPPTGRPTSTRSLPVTRALPRGASSCRRGGGSSSTRWSSPRRTRSPGPTATPCSCPPMTPRAWASPRGRRCGCAPTPARSRPASTWHRSGPATCRCSGRSATP